MPSLSNTPAYELEAEREELKALIRALPNDPSSTDALRRLEAINREIFKRLPRVGNYSVD